MTEPAAPAATPASALTTSPPRRTLGADGRLYPPPPADARLTRVDMGVPRIVGLVGVAAGVFAAFAGALPAGAALFAVSFAGTILLAQRSVRRANAALGRAAALIASRDLDAAEALLTELAHKPGGNSQVHGLALVQLAGVRALRGDVEGWLALLAVAQKSVKLRRGQPAIGELIPFQIARAFALNGEVDAAEAWLAFANKGRNFTQPYTVDVVAAVLAARRGRYAEAAALLEKHWVQLETSATGDAMKAQRILLAYCLERSNGDAARVAQLLAGATPLGFEVRALLAPWAELRAWALAKLPGEALPG